MKKYGLRIISVCWLILLPLYAGAQTPPSAEGETPQTAPVPKTRPTAQPTQPSQPTPIEPELQLELGAWYEHLSNGSGTWQTYFLSMNRKFASGQTLYATASTVQRFHLTDPNLMVGFVQPLDHSRHWIATFEAAGSSSHQVLPQYALYAEIAHVFGGGWVGHAGIRHSKYGPDRVNIGVFNVEKYIKQYRFAYTLFVANLNGQSTATAHVFTGNYYYGDRNSVGLNVAFGQEIESIGEGVLVQTPVREVSINGKHWMNDKWGFSYWAGWHRQGTLYTRSGGQIGLLLRF